jgi:hypothetical protein
VRNVIEFPGTKRAAQIAAQLCQKNGYGLHATQALQRDTVRWMQMTGVSAYEAAHRIVRGPREPFFGPYGSAA